MKIFKYFKCTERTEKLNNSATDEWKYKMNYFKSIKTYLFIHNSVDFQRFCNSAQSTHNRSLIPVQQIRLSKHIRNKKQSFCTKTFKTTWLNLNFASTFSFCVAGSNKLF